MVRVERLLLHKGDANNVLPTAYRSDMDIVYRTVCIAIHQCIVLALIEMYSETCLKWISSGLQYLDE